MERNETDGDFIYVSVKLGVISSFNPTTDKLCLLFHSFSKWLVVILTLHLLFVLDGKITDRHQSIRSYLIS